MEMVPQGGNGGETPREGSNEVSDCQAPLPEKAEDLTGRTPQTPLRASPPVPGMVEHPRTPAPWARQRTDSNRLSQEAAGGKRRALSLSCPPSLPAEVRAWAPAGGGGDQPSRQAPGSTQAQQKGRSSLPEQPPSHGQSADALEDFLSHFLTYLQECPERPCFRGTKELSPGRGYDYEKFLCPGEFEVMLSIPVPACIQYTEVDGYGGLFYSLTLLRKSHGFPAALLLEDGKTLSPRNVMEEFWQYVDHFLKDFHSGWQVRLEKKKPNCHAVSLAMLDSRGAKFLSVDLVPALEVIGQWPCTKKAKDLLRENELLHLMRVFYFVAKQSPGRNSKETWSICFSPVEKEILNCHRSPEACCQCHGAECCRIDCLKKLEDVVGTLQAEYPQMLAPLSRYHIRTSFLHSLWEWREDEDWKPSEVAQCFERVLTNFINEVAAAHLIHFFLPKCNLYGAKFFPATKLKFLWVRLREKEGATKTFIVSRRKGSSALMVPVLWPLVITLGLVALVLVLLPHVAP